MRSMLASVVKSLPAIRSVMSRPREASRRRPEAVIVPSGKASLAAVESRIGASRATLPTSSNLCIGGLHQDGVPWICFSLDDRSTSQSSLAMPFSFEMRCRYFSKSSHELLSEPERLVLRRLAVFAGDFTAEAASMERPMARSSHRQPSAHWPTSSRSLWCWWRSEA